MTSFDNSDILAFLYLAEKKADIPDAAFEVENFGNKNELDPFDPLKGSDPLKDVFLVKDVLDVKLATQARTFLAAVPLASDNISTNNIWQSIILEPGYREFSLNKDIHMWRWENYKPDIRRCAPLNLSSFLNPKSPIAPLLQKLRHVWTLLHPELEMLQMVIQLIEKDKAIRIHNDKWHERRMAFVYYLTPDDWSSADGGNFHILIPDGHSPDNLLKFGCTIYCKDNGHCVQCTTGFSRIKSFVPQFNTMICMKMTTSGSNEGCSPFHEVDKVLSDKKRISIVGFLKDCSTSKLVPSIESTQLF